MLIRLTTDTERGRNLIPIINFRKVVEGIILYVSRAMSGVN